MGPGTLAEFKHCNVLQTIIRSLDFILWAVGHTEGFEQGYSQICSRQLQMRIVGRILLNGNNFSLYFTELTRGLPFGQRMLLRLVRT